MVWRGGRAMSHVHTMPEAPPQIPPLRDGDRLARVEFERRYDAMPQSTRAELIEGGRSHAIAGTHPGTWESSSGHGYSHGDIPPLYAWHQRRRVRQRSPGPKE